MIPIPLNHPLSTHLSALGSKGFHTTPEHELYDTLNKMVIDGAGGHLLIFSKEDQNFVWNDISHEKSTSDFTLLYQKKKMNFYVHPNKVTKPAKMEDAKNEDGGRQTRSKAKANEGQRTADNDKSKSPAPKNRPRTL